MADEGTWHGRKEPAKKPEPIKLHMDDEPRVGTPINLENLGPIVNEWELEKELLRTRPERNKAWDFFPVILAAIVSAWLIVTTVEGIATLILTRVAAEKMKDELEKFERRLK